MIDRGKSRGKEVERNTGKEKEGREEGREGR